MANSEHVELAKQGSDAIRQWRVENPEVKLDLGGANLAGADIRGAILHMMDLPEADLHGANLAHADAWGKPEQGQLV